MSANPRIKQTRPLTLLKYQHYWIWISKTNLITFGCIIVLWRRFAIPIYSICWEGELLWQSLIGRGPRHAIPIFLLENHMVGLIRFVTVHDSAMQSRLPFSSVLPHFCTRNFCGLKKSAILLLGIQSTTPNSNFWLTICTSFTLVHYILQLSLLSPQSWSKNL